MLATHSGLKKNKNTENIKDSFSKNFLIFLFQNSQSFSGLEGLFFSTEKKESNDFSRPIIRYIRESKRKSFCEVKISQIKLHSASAKFKRSGDPLSLKTTFLIQNYQKHNKTGTFVKKNFFEKIEHLRK